MKRLFFLHSRRNPVINHALLDFLGTYAVIMSDICVRKNVKNSVNITECGVW